MSKMLQESASRQQKHGRLTVAQLRTHIAEQSFETLPSVLEGLRDDERVQVKQMVARAWTRHAKEQAARNRVNAMYELMYSLGDTDGVIVGVDEVGRGSLAGPLTVAAVALPSEPRIWGLNDSKQLTPLQREELAKQIKEHALAIGIAHIPPDEIDACGMSASLRVAMRRSIDACTLDPACVLIDGVPVNVHPAEIAVTHGDARIACIAAASIIAKVTRDAIMVEADAIYPGYHFAESKGYGSPEHIEAIRRIGLSPLHRASFCRNFSGSSDSQR